MHIPIVNMNFFKKNIPDKAFLFAWNLKKKSLKKEKNFTKQKK